MAAKALTRVAFRSADAQSYRLGGREPDAEKILIACQRHQRTRGGLTKRSKLWNWFLGVTVGYGYRLHRVFLFLLALGLIGWWLFQWGVDFDLIHLSQGDHRSASAACPVGFPCFNAPIYSFQLLVPGLDLREVTYWGRTPASTSRGAVCCSSTHGS
ncbi:MAG TPA: hypothetical protein VNF47_08865 [Streptosporangiaceae bacterium]|nr:hypothetical protein [Streptosporangiaceae bacterium]